MATILEIEPGKQWKRGVRPNTETTFRFDYQLGIQYDYGQTFQIHFVCSEQ